MLVSRTIGDRHGHWNTKSDATSVRLFNNLASFDPEDSVGLCGGWKLTCRRDDYLTGRNVFKKGSGATVIKFREHIVKHEYRR
jgi:hypothetical protein